jgi:SWI/SNF-related matrix-associated actin-dependent regulator 1 of chromatin subfamily A
MLSIEEKNRLRVYQQEALKFMTEHKGYILYPNTRGVALEYDDMGLGKTLTTLSAIFELDAFPCIIVCPKFALMVWQEQIRQWFNEEAVIYSGKPKDREAQWKEFITKGIKFLITNYALLPELAIRSGIDVKKARTAINTPGTQKWGGIVWDEAHMGGLFNHKSQTYKISLKLAKQIPTRYVLTGTPYRQGCVDLFGPLSLLDPQKFDSYWKYVNQFCTVIKTPFGKEIERNPANVQGFRQMLSKYMIRRLKEGVLTELPGKLRQPLYVEMNAEQKKLYDDLTANLIAEIPDSDDIIITPNQMTLIVRQRQILACPQELGLKERGGAIDAIIEHSHLRLDDNKPIVVFTPFRKALPYLEQAFKEEYPECRIYTIRGQLTSEEFGKAWMGFQNDKYKQRILLCVIKSGASFQATAADTAYFLGYEYDFNLNEQAEDRLNRMGQQNFVNIYYLMHKGTIDEDVAKRLNEKKSSSNWVVGSEEQYLKMLRNTYGNRGVKEK